MARRSPRLSREESTPVPKTPVKLATVSEREETPDHGVKHSLIPIETPSNSPTKATPSSTTGINPNPSEMHPSKFHSTTKKAASEARFGWLPKTGGNDSTTSKDIAPPDPPKTAPRPSSQNPFSSPSFDFRFTRPSSELSIEAMKMMSELRDQAARIKQELAAGREFKEQDSAVSGRKIAKPKGKVGRFSDVHMEQFKKMDSIANHPSLYRADPAKSTPTKKSLKRTNSKAELDKPDEVHFSPTKPGTTVKVPVAEPTTPAKRLKQQDFQTSRPSFRRGHNAALKPSTPSLPRPTSGASSLSNPEVSTPKRTHRPTSAHNLTATGSKIPSLNRNPSTKSLADANSVKPVVPQTEATNKFRKGFSSKLQGVKSILRRPQLRFSNDPLKLAAGTHFSPSKSTDEAAVAATATTPQGPNNMAIFNAPQRTPGTPSYREEKHVNFSPNPAHVIGSSQADTPNTPSPHKQRVAEPIGYPQLPTAPPTNFFSDVLRSPKTDTVAMDSMAKIQSSAPGTGDFTFRSDNTISFAPSPSPCKLASTAQTTTTPTIRKVRASDSSAFAPISGSKLIQVPNIPHGLSNKKRKRSDPNSGSETHNRKVNRASAEDKENDDLAEDMDGSPIKRRRTMAAGSASRSSCGRSIPNKPGVRASGVGFRKQGTPMKAKGKGVLSLSRLSELARPKERK